MIVPFKPLRGRLIQRPQSRFYLYYFLQTIDSFARLQKRQDNKIGIRDLGQKRQHQACLFSISAPLHRLARLEPDRREEYLSWRTNSPISPNTNGPPSTSPSRSAHCLNGSLAFVHATSSIVFFSHSANDIPNCSIRVRSKYSVLRWVSICRGTRGKRTGASTPMILARMASTRGSSGWSRSKEGDEGKYCSSAVAILRESCSDVLPSGSVMAGIE